MGVNMNINSQGKDQKHNPVACNTQQRSKPTVTALTQFEPTAKASGGPGAKAFEGIDETRVDSGTWEPFVNSTAFSH